ncbi:DNA-directed RNA polymerase, mitochondrial [Rhipicephalus sanguineus]|uniref:DNA-directed RNA polymerase, mitochondrial n=1 Tax=Rhipicephalus sanguineus TaxID=34632 RepID=UPI001895AC3C|nr:DNA-directed RNA polymerase, mitochondrial [Rhipicephalus sanguineus]
MYNSVVRKCSLACDHLRSVRRLLWTLRSANHTQGGARCEDTARTLREHRCTNERSQAMCYATSAEPSYKPKTRKTKVGKQRRNQYRELMKVLEAHKMKLEGTGQLSNGNTYHRKEIILTIPSTCNVISLPINCAGCTITCEKCAYNTEVPTVDNYDEVATTADMPSTSSQGLLRDPPSAEEEDLVAIQGNADIMPPVLPFAPHVAEHFDVDLTEDDLHGPLEEPATSKPAVSSASKKKTDSSTFRLSPSQHDKVAKIKKADLERLAQEMQFRMSIRAFVEVCVHANMLDKALSALHYHRHRTREQKKGITVVDIGIYNSLIRGYAAKGKLSRVQEIMHTMEHDRIKPNAATFASLLECHTLQSNFSRENVEKVIEEMKAHDIIPQQLFRDCKFFGNQRERVLEAIQKVMPDFVPEPSTFPRNYDCKLLRKLKNQKTLHKPHETPGDLPTLEELRQCAREQMGLETDGQVTVQSVAKLTNPSEKVLQMRKQVQELEASWKVKLKDAFVKNTRSLLSHSYMNRGMSLYPYLCVLEPDAYVNIMLQEVRALAMSSETFSPSLLILHHGVGVKVMTRYMTAVKERNGIASKVSALYDKYLEYCLEPELWSTYTARECWQRLNTENCEGPSLDVEISHWPFHAAVGIGRFLYDIIFHEVKIDINAMRPSSTKAMVPAFYNIYRTVGVRTKEEIKPHPLLSKLYREASLEELAFDIGLVPMVSPPLPWSDVNSGIFLLTQSPLVRLPETAQQQKLMLEETPVQQMYPSFDSLNILGLCPWRINKPVLDLVIEVFLNKGSAELDIPIPPSEHPAPPKFEPGMSKADKVKITRERLFNKRRRAEMYSLWCDALYKLSIANHFRDRVFWFPHNMDFRGRVYPCPPHFNHLGSDVVRGILLFARGEPLGEKGLDWLKIHLVNLTGLKKREPVSERLRFANEMMPEILDSADNPMTGRRWWAKSDEPWQTLACCKEVAAAVRSPDPTRHICYLPVHQDGSCNGLQHYAALGRDAHGGSQVNLQPADRPQDVYSGVAALVEQERQKDAANGLYIAKVLEGHIKRKVVKQTVMTVVYGVTRFGAHLQILKQLKDLDDFPQEHCWAAAHYLVQKTFLSLQQMFTATREIQDWFTICAKMISYVCCQPVSWVTPLGLPVIQPYHKPTSVRSPISYGDRISAEYRTIFEMHQRPNVMKQKNGFPPNFIHSLDSSHMMLTAIYCQKAGIQFVSVHDCYWTHPNTVDIMNKICREQFVALHSEPILEDLSKHFVRTFGYKESEMAGVNKAAEMAMQKLNKVIKQIPQKGSFKLENVLDSVYFFS